MRLIFIFLKYYFQFSIINLTRIIQQKIRDVRLCSYMYTYMSLLMCTRALCSNEYAPDETKTKQIYLHAKATNMANKCEIYFCKCIINTRIA